MAETPKRPVGRPKKSSGMYTEPLRCTVTKSTKEKLLEISTTEGLQMSALPRHIILSHLAERELQIETATEVYFENG